MSTQLSRQRQIEKINATLDKNKDEEPFADGTYHRCQRHTCIHGELCGRAHPSSPHEVVIRVSKGCGDARCIDQSCIACLTHRTDDAMLMRFMRMYPSVFPEIYAAYVRGREGSTVTVMESIPLTLNEYVLYLRRECCKTTGELWEHVLRTMKKVVQCRKKAAAHGLVYHGDFTMANILVDEDGTNVRIIDLDMSIVRESGEDEMDMDAESWEEPRISQTELSRGFIRAKEDLSTMWHLDIAFLLLQMLKDLGSVTLKNVIRQIVAACFGPVPKKWIYKIRSGKYMPKCEDVSVMVDYLASDALYYTGQIGRVDLKTLFSFDHFSKVISARIPPYPRSQAELPYPVSEVMRENPSIFVPRRGLDPLELDHHVLRKELFKLFTKIIIAGKLPSKDFSLRDVDLTRVCCVKHSCYSDCIVINKFDSPILRVNNMEGSLDDLNGLCMPDEVIGDLVDRVLERECPID